MLDMVVNLEDWFSQVVALIYYFPFLFVLQTYISELTPTYIAELSPDDEILLAQLKCCESWQKPEDLEYFAGLKNNLWIAVRDAAIRKMYDEFFRRKREVGMCLSQKFEIFSFGIVCKQYITRSDNIQIVLLLC